MNSLIVYFGAYYVPYQMRSYQVCHVKIVQLFFLLMPTNILDVRAEQWTGTTVIASLSATELVIGADSKQTGGGGAVGRARIVCKIIQGDNVVFVAAGLSEETVTGFNVRDIFERATKGRRLQQAVEEFKNSVREPLEQAVAHIGRNYPAELQKQINSGITLKTVIGGMEGSVPVLFAQEFFVKLSNGTMQLHGNSNRFIKSKPFLLMAGEYDAISEFLDRNPEFEQEEPVKKVLKLIEVEIATGNPKIGPPVDVVRITKRAIEWIQRKPECHPK
jgi:hypothetical protein